MEHLYTFAKIQVKTMQLSLHLLTPRQAFAILEAQSVPKCVKHCPYAKFSEKGTNPKKKHKWEKPCFSMCTFFCILWRF